MTLQYHLDNLDNIIRMTGEHLEGNSFYLDGQMGHLCPSFETKRNNLSYYSKEAKNIIEIGFNGGHSCLLFLLSNPYSKIQLFDLGNHRYAKLCYEYLNNTFPDRLNITWGDSSVTYSQFNPNIKYDLIHIDGSHMSEILNKDIINSLRCVDNNGYIIIDDISFHPKHMLLNLTEQVVDRLIDGTLIMVAPHKFSNFHIIVKKG